MDRAWLWVRLFQTLARYETSALHVCRTQCSCLPWHMISSHSIFLVELYEGLYTPADARCRDGGGLGIITCQSRFFFKSNAVSELVIYFLYTIGVFLCGRAATATSAPPIATPS